MRSRVRERRTHGSVRDLRREPLVYSTVWLNVHRNGEHRIVSATISNYIRKVYWFIYRIGVLFPVGFQIFREL